MRSKKRLFSPFVPQLCCHAQRITTAFCRLMMQNAFDKGLLDGESGSNRELEWSL
jgi:hypothetical protein